MVTLLERGDIIDGLRELVSELRAAGEVAGIRLVGGAALALRYFERGVTQDLDSLHVNPGSDAGVAAAAAIVAARRGWDSAWINFEVTRADAIPSLGRQVRWETVYSKEGIVIDVASADALLAMKLRANRPGRDTGDIRQLLALCSVSTLSAAEDLYEDFYPGDSLPQRAIVIVEAILAEGEPHVPSPLPPFEI